MPENLTVRSPGEQQALLGAITERILPGARAILGGDFNTSPLDEARLQQVSPAEALRLSGCWGGIVETLSARGLRRIPTADGVPTGLDGTMHYSAEHVIDHVFATEGVVCVGGPEVGPLPREGGQGPWGAGDDHDGSDHAWLRVSLQPKM